MQDQDADEEYEAEKAEFEKWARGMGADDNRLKWIDAYEGEGYYESSEIDYAWAGWLARAMKE